MQKRAARRGQRALAFLLCLLMVVTLLPVMGASAAEGDVSAEGVKLSKTLTLETDGTYTINLKAYATGTVTSTTVTEPVPTDFVLVLDQSGSMAEKITSYTYTEKTSQGYSYSSLRNQTLYYKDGDTYYQVKRDSYETGSWLSSTDHYYLYYQKDGTTYYLSGTGTTTTRPSQYTSRSDIIWTGVLYQRTATSSQTKLAALKEAVTNFVTSVQNQKDANGAPVDHRIAIVGFAQKGSGSQWNWDDNQNSELFIGATQYNYSSTEILSQYGNALQDVTTDAGRSNLTASINALAALGGTYPQLGFEMANGIFNAYREKNDYQYSKADGEKANRGTVVVMFTDGEPGTGGTVDTDVANETMQQAKTSKNTYGAKVFTIGVFSLDNSNLSDINTYMNAVSSNRQPTASETPTMNNQGGTAKPASDPTNYYAMATDSEALNDAFQSVSSSVNNSSTSCELDADSVLTDVISGNLDLPEGFNVEENVTVSTATCSGKDENGNPTFADPVKFPNASVTVDGKTVDVSNFSYKDNYVTGDNGTGKKLIVTITGLLPNRDGADMPSNESTSGIYDDGHLVAPFEVPAFSVDLENRVVDFGMTVNIGANVLNTNAATNQYGTFALNSEAYTYKLNPVKDSNGNYTFGFTGVDSSLYFADGAWTKVNVIPANNVYYDDDLLNEQSDFNDGNYGYDVNVPTTTNTMTVEGGTSKTFTFTGTGIDVYCTTEQTSGWVTARLSKMVDGTDTYVDGAIMKNEYVSTKPLYNVPTLSFTGLDYGTYTLTINTDNYSNYKLDGVRIYNPAQNNSEVTSKYEANETNATFTQVRQILLNDQKNFSVDSEVTGAVYVDEQHEGADLAKYEKEGPKNEVYLGENDAIAFTVRDYQPGQKVMVGLSAPEEGRGSVYLTKEEGKASQAINSAIDEYFEVIPDANGNVVIKNAGTSLISVTNVKVSGTGASSASFEVSPQLMSYVAGFDTLSVVQPEPEPTPDPEPPVNNASVSAIIRAIWAQVMDGIGKLFGRL